MDGQLQPLVSSLPSYLKDTNHLLNAMKEVVWKHDYIWVKCDFPSLHSSIPHHLARQAVSFYLEHSTALPLPQRLFILEVLDYLLLHNHFIFDGTFYLQRCGAAMGAKFLPSFANLFMG